MNDLVTIGIPAYKSEYLKESIASALNQKYDNIEIVIVNDASPYNLDTIVNSFDDTRIRYYRNKKNLGHGGIANNWNKCLEYATGDFFVLLCDDDLLNPYFVKNLVQLAKQYPECNVFHANRSILHNDTGWEEKDSLWKSVETHEEYVNFFFNGRKHSVTEFLFRTDHIRPLKYQNFPVGWYSDNASIMLFSKGGIIVSSLDQLAVFRQSDNHITSNLHLNPQKAYAARLFIRWLKENEICPHSYLNNKRKIEYESLTYLYGARSWTKFLVILFLPISNITILKICSHILHLIEKKTIDFLDCLETLIISKK